MKARTGEDNDQTRLAKEINARNAAREQERAALRDELRGVQQQIQQIQALIRRGVEKVKETVKGLVRGPQPDHADTPDEPPTPRGRSPRRSHSKAAIAALTMIGCRGTGSSDADDQNTR